jgi:biopolymer transport protein ExbD
MKIVERLQGRVLARRKCRPLAVGAALEMAMAGFMVIMLIVVMLVEGVTPHHSNMPADMAKARHVVSMPGAKREDAVRIVITRDGAIYFGHLATRVGDLTDQIRQKVRDGSERRVYMKVDRRAKYGDVEAVVDAIRGSGIWQVGLLVEQDQRLVTQP